MPCAITSSAARAPTRYRQTTAQIQQQSARRGLGKNFQIFATPGRVASGQGRQLGNRPGAFRASLSSPEQPCVF
jgi:hypothetical protein